MTFEDLPTVPRSEELIDTAFSRAARAGRAKSGIEAQQSMLVTASNIISDNLQNVSTTWPDFDALDPFYHELADAVADGGVDTLKQHLSEVMWASEKTAEIRSEYQSRLRGDTETAQLLRKQAFARLADVTREVSGDLEALNEARDQLKQLPDIRPDEPAIVIAGYPNVGKSTFVNHVTNARNEIASYPFTTKRVQVGHIDRNHIRYQLIDTPGLLDRPAADRNDIESQAVSALTHLADCILVFIDASASCGYPVDVQLTLRDELKSRFDGVPVVTVCAKADQSRELDADLYLSVPEEEGVDELLEAAIDRIDHTIELPYEPTE
ncbi:NOG1 family protein [Halocatena pleomorpha]|uniref:GTP-binding protein n=1 Tax=Halocatena pleomorpha TaxID=1785090 RepID=A0A3P3RJJ0_9EURY|nr:GTPase [Halocatena pleomorpha]RRJ33504.1 GTP-binding protein [Halocatena pleomorpha]